MKAILVSVCLLLCLQGAGPCPARAGPVPAAGNPAGEAPRESSFREGVFQKAPLDPEALKQDLSYARGETPDTEGWPRTVRYDCKMYDYRSGRFQEGEQKIFTIRKKPDRIIPHAVGVAEILWAICPRERIVGFMEFAADPDFCVLFEEVKRRGPIIKQTQTELMIGMKPDLVFTVFYSDAAFKQRLTRAGIPLFELGFFGTLDSIREQILLIGTVIGEKGNAQALVNRVDEKVRELKARIPRTPHRARVLFYDTRGYVPGIRSNFNSICELIDVTNVGAEQGVDSWSQIDHETFLKWDPDIVIVPAGRNLEEELRRNPVLAHARAVKDGRIFAIPHLYLSVNSQYIVLSADLIAGIVYGNDCRTRKEPGVP